MLLESWLLQKKIITNALLAPKSREKGKRDGDKGKSDRVAKRKRGKRH